jgi:hypothetical protein
VCLDPRSRSLGAPGPCRCPDVPALRDHGTVLIGCLGPTDRLVAGGCPRLPRPNVVTWVMIRTCYAILLFPNCCVTDSL